MQTYGRLPGFQFLYKTSSSNAVIVRVPAEGVLGAFGRKQEFLFKRSDTDDNSEEFVELIGCLPTWAHEKGVLAQVENELNRRQFPQLYRE